MARKGSYGVFCFRHVEITWLVLGAVYPHVGEWGHHCGFAFGRRICGETLMGLKQQSSSTPGIQLILSSIYCWHLRELEECGSQAKHESAARGWAMAANFPSHAAAASRVQLIVMSCKE